MGTAKHQLSTFYFVYSFWSRLMSYIHKQKFNISDLVPEDLRVRHVLVVEPEYYSRQLYVKHLREHGFKPAHSSDLSEGLVLLKSLKPQAAILSPHAESSYENFIYALSLVRKMYPELPIITVGEALPVSVLAEIMGLGVSGHLEKKLTRPGDIVTVINAILI